MTIKRSLFPFLRELFVYCWSLLKTYNLHKDHRKKEEKLVRYIGVLSASYHSPQQECMSAEQGAMCFLK